MGRRPTRVAGGGGGGGGGEADSISEYERERLENIRRNRELMESLGVAQAKEEMAAAVASPATPFRTWTRTKRRASSFGEKDASPPVTPLRASRRLRGESAALTAPARTGDGDDEASESQPDVVDDPDAYAADQLKSAEEYFPAQVVEKAVRVDSHFRGWVKPEVCERLGIEGNAAEAWERNGGGTFSFKNPLGLPTLPGQKSPKRSLAAAAPRGWSEARYVSSQLLKKNPNAYFYRHTEPGVEQWTGAWTDDEIELFLDTARKYGAGDKWGLFATYIPHRVGYQCSNFYRSDMLPKGLIIDSNYKITPGGVAVYVGPHMRGRS